MTLLTTQELAHGLRFAHPNLHSLPLWSLHVPPLLSAFSPPNLDLIFVKHPGMSQWELC